MTMIPVDRFNLNRFWEKTPTPLKYFLVLTILIAISYFFFSKKIYESQVLELEKMEQGITATYDLIDKFEEFRIEQKQYNRQVLIYLQNLHTLVDDLNQSTSRKFDMILKSGDKNSDVIIDKLMLLNESFEKLSRAYSTPIEEPNLDDNKINSKIIVEPVKK